MTALSVTNSPRGAMRSWGATATSHGQPERPPPGSKCITPLRVGVATGVSAQTTARRLTCVGDGRSMSPPGRASTFASG